MANGLLLYCRPGFEKECLAEITEISSQQGIFGWCKLEMNSGFLIFETEQADLLVPLLADLVFTRDGWAITKRLNDLNPNDRLTPIQNEAQAALGELNLANYGQVLCEFAEGDEYRATSRFAGKFVNPLRQSLRQNNLASKKDDKRLPALRVFFKDSSQALIGVDDPKHRAVWPMGIARLKFPKSAPSRSTLKLEEAFHFYLGQHWRQQLDDCHNAVDLGASPGGWTWQLVNQDIHVYAVDNGPMDKALMDTGLVEHVEGDGFVWTPPRGIDWLVCDMVESPARVAQLMYDWLHKRYAKRAIFNLKLPMKKRYAEWLTIKESLMLQIAEQHPKAILRAKHLYHDREEITVFLDLNNQHG